MQRAASDLGAGDDAASNLNRLARGEGVRHCPRSFPRGDYDDALTTIIGIGKQWYLGAANQERWVDRLHRSAENRVGVSAQPIECGGQ
jgi:hypothetical protein